MTIWRNWKRISGKSKKGELFIALDKVGCGMGLGRVGEMLIISDKYCYFITETYVVAHPRTVSSRQFQPLKHQTKIAADILIFLLLSFKENKA